MKRDLCDLPAISGTQLAKTLHKTRPTSPGMDSIAPYELQLLSRWCPDIMDILASLLDLVERTGKWPEDLPKGAVTFIPKNICESPSPTDYRPLTILSSIYRLWAAARHDQLCDVWLPKWRSTQAYGLKQSNAADALAFETCLQIQTDIQNGHIISGISYDMQKCFDSIPVGLVIQVFNQRGADSKVVKALSGFYAQHTKFFQIEGSFAHAYRPHNGIIQGCPLSMMLLTSLITTWIEHCQKVIPATVPRSYADDLSICARSHAKGALIDQTRLMHTITDGFISDAGMTINPNKCFTFGHTSIAGSITHIPHHKNQFRLVGGSVKIN